MRSLLSTTTFLCLLAVTIPGAVAGPACARKHLKTQDCITLCKSKWGWPGRMMGSDPWGPVMRPALESNWDEALAKACSVEPQSSSVPVANAQTGKVTLLPASTALSAAPVVATPSGSAPASFNTSAVVNNTSTSSSRVVPSFTSTKIFLPTLISHSIKPSTSSPIPVPTTSSSKFTPALEPRPTTSSTEAPQPTIAPPASGNGSGGSSAGSGSGDVQAYLESHNSVRAQHGAAPLSWSNDLAAKAQQWANNCKFQHSGGSLGRLGENLAAGTGAFSIQEAIQSWADEVSEYNPSNPQPSHFTQVVWKGTTQLGCAVQSCDGIFDAKARFYVCEYSPAGNVIGQIAQNVQA